MPLSSVRRCSGRTEPTYDEGTCRPHTGPFYGSLQGERIVISGAEFGAPAGSVAHFGQHPVMIGGCWCACCGGVEELSPGRLAVTAPPERGRQGTVDAPVAGAPPPGGLSWKGALDLRRQVARHRANISAPAARPVSSRICRSPVALKSPHTTVNVPRPSSRIHRTSSVTWSCRTRVWCSGQSSIRLPAGPGRRDSRCRPGPRCPHGPLPQAGPRDQPQRSASGRALHHPTSRLLPSDCRDGWW